MKTKFTKGEWYKTEKGSDGDIYIYHPDIGTIAIVTQDLIAQDANAQLLLSAPKLLKALKDCQQVLFDYVFSDETPEMCNFAEAESNALEVIRKATDD